MIWPQANAQRKTVTQFIQRHWLNLSSTLLVCITALSLHPLNTLPEVPGSDKTHHFVAYAALAFPTAPRKPRRGSSSSALRSTAASSNWSSPVWIAKENAWIF